MYYAIGNVFYLSIILKAHLSTTAFPSLHRYWEKNDTSTRSLPITLFRCLWRRIIINGVLVSAEVRFTLVINFKEASFRILTDLTFQKGLLMVECILLGYFTEYFSIAFPSHKETRDAYLYATGKT